MKRSGVWALGLMVASLLVPLERGNAASLTTIIPVSATVVAACSISGTGLNFGNYDGSQLASTGTITVTCSQDHPYNVTLDKGASAPIGGNRVLLSQGAAGRSLNYFLYKDSGLTQEWGDSGFAGTYNQGTSVAGTGTGSAQALTIYGKLPANQLTGAATSTYADRVVATLLF